MSLYEGELPWVVAGTKECKCEGWINNIGDVDEGVRRYWESFRYAWKYGTEEFVFCPWCGKALVEREKRDEPSDEEIHNEEATDSDEDIAF